MDQVERTSAVEAQQRLGTLLDEVKLKGAVYVIERASRPTAVVVPLETYQKYLDVRDRASTGWSQCASPCGGTVRG